jgi:hypothetical protein
MNSNEEQQLLVAVLGAGPVGLAAAAHLIERGLTSLILEAGSEVGANLATYRHVRLFSPWQYNVDKAARRLLQQHATPVIDGIDRIICAAGARPDLALTRELRVRHDPWLESTDALAPLIDPNEHSCGTVRPHGHNELAHPEPGYYAVGVKSYGRAPNFLMATGYEQVRSVVAALVGDTAAADDVQLDLPETGVCNTRLAYDDTASEPVVSCPALAVAARRPRPAAAPD